MPIDTCRLYFLEHLTTNEQSAFINAIQCEGLQQRAVGLPDQHECN